MGTVLGPTRLNQAVFGMGDYTLRRTDVNDASERAGKLGRKTVDARLGDPTVFGLKTYPRYTALVEEALRDPRSLSYGDARGVNDLREILGRGNVEFGRDGYAISPERIFIGSGISGVTRSLFTAITNKGDEVVIPKWSYIIYFAEAALSEAKVVNVRLAERGEVDLNSLRDSITKNTKAIFVTTVGNPLGVAMRMETFSEIIRIVNAKERVFNHPIYLVADTIYEGFRTGSPCIDPIALSIKEGRLGPTIELYSISKLISAPGARIGWMRIYHNNEDFKDEVDDFVESLARLFQPTLGATATPFQSALAKLYSGLSQQGLRNEFEDFKTTRRIEAIGRTRKLLDALSEIDGLVFPEYYYNEGRIDCNSLNSFYVLFGVDKSLRPRAIFSQARELADFLLETEGYPVLLATPGDSFLASELRGKEQEFMRVVALFENSAEVVQGIKMFVESKRGRPHY